MKTKKPADLSEAEIRAMLEELVEVFWPAGDPDHEWDSETAEAAAQVLVERGLRPELAQEVS